MDIFDDSLFNRRRNRHQSKLKRWRYAGLMLTYRCSATCRFCYYYCTPQAGGLMTAETAINAWEGLIRLAGREARVHITGGEPFLYFDRLVEILQQAHRLKLTPVDSVETNASWGTHSGQITDKLRQLDALGMNRLKISWDPFHEEFIDIQSVRDLVSAARSVLGPDRVLVRWEKHLEAPSGIRGKTEPEKQRILQEALVTDPCRLTGRAADSVATLAPAYPVEHFMKKNCQNALLSAKGVHIDPYGNVFNGQCSGMLVGNIARTPLDVLWQQFEPDISNFWKVLYHDGPCGFLEQAGNWGYSPLLQYASKCHLCANIRRFFFDKRCFPSIINPADCYGKHQS